MRAIWSLVVVVLVAATGAPRARAASRDATALGVAHHDAALVPARRSASVTRHRADILVAVPTTAPAIVTPSRAVIDAAPPPHAPDARPHDIVRSARGPPRR